MLVLRTVFPFDFSFDFTLDFVINFLLDFSFDFWFDFWFDFFFDFFVDFPFGGRSSLDLSRSLRIAADNLDFVRSKFGARISLELDILHKKGPDVVAEAVGLEMSLESESSLDLLGKNVGNGLVEVAQDLHCKLRFNSAVVDQLVDGVYQTVTDSMIDSVSIA